VEFRSKELFCLLVWQLLAAVNRLGKNLATTR
jgi:hypothetical protein